jgi:Ser/Thr protein kinase RdoA (MazF antagonist)
MRSAVTSGILTAYPFGRLAVVGAFEASTRNDNWLVEDEGGRREQVLEAAWRLAQFHAIAETFPGEAVLLDYQPPIRDWWVSAEDNLQALEVMFAGVAVQDELAYLRDWWRWVLAEWPLARLDALPVGWVYGDYHGRNMVFMGDGLRGLFDLDDLERGPLVVDVARGVHMFGREARGR